MNTPSMRLALAAALALLVACGSDSSTSTTSTSTARGTLVADPPFRIASLNAADLTAQLSNSAFAPLLPLTGTPACGVDFYYIKYWTVGGSNEAALVSGALMVPTGSAPQCSGARPIVLHAHGTQVDQAMNIADPTNPNNQEGVLIAATFAAQGYIVVAPNYVGYDISSNYHPFVNETAQASDMIDALAAARAALPRLLSNATTDSGKLFISGNSEGGYVAMATQKAMQAAHMTVTAAAGNSGPYALEAYADSAFTGHVSIFSTLFYPMMITGFQLAYGNAYGSPSATTADFYEAAYASTIEGLLPNVTPVDGPTGLIAQGKIPALALFNINPPVTGNPQLDALLAVPQVISGDPETAIFNAGFGPGNLIKNEARVVYVEDMASNPDLGLLTLTCAVNPSAPGCSNPGLPNFGLAASAPVNGLRHDLYANDLRDWTPMTPVFMCGGGKDPVVFYPVNTGLMASWWQSQGVSVAHTTLALQTSLVAVLDLETGLGPDDPYAPFEEAFQATIAAEYQQGYDAAHKAWLDAHPGDTVNADLKGQEGGGAMVAQDYHHDVAPFCTAAARGYFSSF